MEKNMDHEMEAGVRKGVQELQLSYHKMYIYIYIYSIYRVSPI